MGPLLCGPLVFTCDMKGLLFLCQSWSIINHQGDPLAGDSIPTETRLFHHIVNEYLLVPGTWLGGHGPVKVQSQESCPPITARTCAPQETAGSQSPPNDNERVLGRVPPRHMHHSVI